MTYDELELKLNELGLKKANMCKEVGISPQILTNAKSRGGHFSAATESKIKTFFSNHEAPSDMLFSTPFEHVAEPILDRIPDKKEMILLYLATLLNDDGFDEAVKRVEELTQLDKYRKEGE